MSTGRSFATVAGLLIATLSTPAAHAVSARFFLSLQGLGAGNPETETDGPVLRPQNMGTDPLIFTAPGHVQRLYIWVQLSEAPTDVLGLNLSFRTTGDVVIVGTNLWNNTFTNGRERWIAFPGTSNTGTPSQLVDITPAIGAGSVTGNISNGSQSVFDDQYIADIRSALVGYIAVQGSAGQVHIVNQGSGFMQIDPSNRIYLGFDDAAGSPPEVVGQPYDNVSPEAEITATTAGDMNCDGLLSVSDIGGFVLALTDPAGYAAHFPSCNPNLGDMDGGGSVTVGDIGLFVQALTGG